MLAVRFRPVRPALLLAVAIQLVGSAATAEFRLLSSATSQSRRAVRFHQLRKMLTLQQLVDSDAQHHLSQTQLEHVPVSLLTFAANHGAPLKYLFKPNHADKRRFIERVNHLTPNSTHLRERASYITALHLGKPHLVPETEVAVVNGQQGLLQRIVQGKNMRYGVQAAIAAGGPGYSKRLAWDDVYALLVLDHISQQLDRKPYNLLVTPSRSRLRLIAIDNEASFSATPSIGASAFPYWLTALVSKETAFRPPSPSLVRRVQQIDPRALEADLLACGLQPGEVSGASQRLIGLQRGGLGAMGELAKSQQFAPLIRSWDRVRGTLK